MKESEVDTKWIAERARESYAAPVDGPDDSQLIIITLLSRLYDINLALLKHHDRDVAKKIFDAHDRGELFNPSMYIPQIEAFDVQED